MSAAPATTGDVRRNLIAERFTLARADLESINQWMYDNPETAYEEHRSSATLADFLAGHGFAVETAVYGLQTAFAARLGDPGRPHVVLCCEYDALPAIGHACGHNLIATTSIGAAHALAPLVDELGVRLTVLGTPGEEGRGGKIEMMKAGAFQDTDVALMIHPAPYDVLDPGFLAVAHLTVDYQGRASHAAMAPELGVNALDAAVQAYVGVSLLRQQMSSADRVHGVIVDGGRSPNVIPARTRSAWSVRSADAASLAALRSRVEACFRAAAVSTGCEMSVVPVGPPYDGMVTDPATAGVFASAAARHGRRMRRARAGEVHGSSDMGNVSRVVPSIHPLVALGNGVPNHDPRFADLTVSDEGRQVLRDGVHMLAETVADLMLGGGSP